MPRYASQPQLPPGNPQGFMPGRPAQFPLGGFPTLGGIGPNSNIAQAGAQAQKDPNPAAQLPVKPQGLATAGGIQQLAQQAKVAAQRARPGWLDLLSPRLFYPTKLAEVQTAGSQAPAAGNQPLGGGGGAAPNSAVQGTGAGTPAKPGGVAGAGGGVPGGPGVGGNPLGMGGNMGGGGVVGAYGVVQPGWGALRPGFGPAPAGITKRAMPVGMPQPTPGLTANMPMPPGPAGMVQPPPGLPPVPPPNGGAPIPQGMGQPALDPTTGQPMPPPPGMGGQPGQPGQPPPGGAPAAGPAGQPTAPDPTTGQPTTSPMQDPPPAPLPMNPRMAPPRPPMPHDHAGLGVTDGLMADKAMADNPTSAGEATEDMQAEAAALGSKTAGYRRRLVAELAQAAAGLRKSAFVAPAAGGEKAAVFAGLGRAAMGLIRGAAKPAAALPKAPPAAAASVSAGTAPTMALGPGASATTAAATRATPMGQIQSQFPLLHHWLRTGQRAGWSAPAAAAGGVGMAKAAGLPALTLRRSLGLLGLGTAGGAAGGALALGVKPPAYRPAPVSADYGRRSRWFPDWGPYPGGDGPEPVVGASAHSPGPPDLPPRTKAGGAARLDAYGKPRIFDSAGTEWFLLAGTAAPDKTAAQADTSLASPARSGTGESTGLSFAAKADHHATGRAAWESVSEYFKGHGKRGKKQPDPFAGKHAADAFVKAANPALRAAGWLLEQGQKFLPGAGNFARGLFGGARPIPVPTPAAGSGFRGWSQSANAVTQNAQRAGQLAASPAMRAGDALHRGWAAAGPQAGMTLGGAALGGFGGHATPFDTGSTWGNMAAGAAAFNPYLNRMVGGGAAAARSGAGRVVGPYGGTMATGGGVGAMGASGAAALGNPLLRGVQGGLFGAGTGGLMDAVAFHGGLRTSDGRPTTNFAQLGGSLGTGFGAVSGAGRALRQLAPAGGAVQQFGNKMRAFGEAGLKPLAFGMPIGRGLGGSAATASVPAALANATRYGRNTAFGVGGVTTASGVMNGVEGRMDDYIASRAPQVAEGAAQYADQYLADRMGHVHGQVDEHLARLGLLNDQGQFDPGHAVGQRLSGGIDGIFRAIGMDPSRMSGLQKLMILGGTGLGGAGVLAGSPVAAGLGGAGALAGLLPRLMPGQGAAPQQMDRPYTPGRPQAVARPGEPMASGLPSPNQLGARNEWAHQGGMG